MAYTGSVSIVRPDDEARLEVLNIEYGAILFHGLRNLVPSAGQQGFGPQRVDNQLYPLIGHLDVNGHIKAAGVGDTQKSLDNLHALVHIDQHRRADPHMVQQTPGNGQGAFLQPGKGDFPAGAERERLGIVSRYPVENSIRTLPFGESCGTIDRGKLEKATVSPLSEEQRTFSSAAYKEETEA